jgi:hypothetical protein
MGASNTEERMREMQDDAKSEAKARKTNQRCGIWQWLFSLGTFE